MGNIPGELMAVNGPGIMSNLTVSITIFYGNVPDDHCRHPPS